jgi:hypothetical protein
MITPIRAVNIVRVLGFICAALTVAFLKDTVGHALSPDGEPVREIARSYNVSHSTISRNVSMCRCALEANCDRAAPLLFERIGTGRIRSPLNSGEKR